MTYKDIEKELARLKDLKRAKVNARYFKTGKGEYGEGDKFIGITVPQQRLVAKRHTDLGLTDIQKLLQSKIHEHRLTALFILVAKYQKGDSKEKEKIFKFYLKNTQHINNWDLVDTSAGYIVGMHLLDKNKSILYKLAQSKNLWEKRIAIMATFAFICENKFTETLKIAKMLLKDEHDLIHKAVGWMLREVGKKDQTVEEKFLQIHYHQMPRTMLRYAIERFSKSKRNYYLKR